MHTPLPQKELEIFAALPDIRVVFDVGARTDTEYIKIRPDIEFHAFEPNPDFFDELCKNVGKRKKTYLINYGLSDTPGNQMYNNDRQMFLYGEELSVKEGHQNLPLTTLDEYCKKQGVNFIDFLKVDTEGYDYKVLCGGHDILKNTRYLQYEYWNNKEQFHQLLENDWYMTYIGDRNVFCERKT